MSGTNHEISLLEAVTARAIEGIPASVDEALELEKICSTDQLAEAADRVSRRWSGDRIETCCIVNARSGRCSEDCKWCAQAARHHTGIKEYEYVDEAEALGAADYNSANAVQRYSLVTSGRKVAPADMDRFCSIFRKVGERTGMHLCASMGLLDASQLRQLREAGVTRYHCNLETASSYFPELCTTHSHADKLRTIRAAREAGMEVCSGGIIGMGETMRQRLELACEARDAGACSMPVNILSPIKGTPLGEMPLLDEDEIVRSVALMRLVAPKVGLRFAGGRRRISQEATARMLRGGISGALVGDMLTTVGNTIADDYRLFESVGLKH